MHRSILDCNLVDPWKDLVTDLGNVTLRGYDTSTYLTGKFANPISSKSVRALSVGDIAHDHCETRRDLYQKKGTNPAFHRGPRSTWSMIAGIVVEGYIMQLKTSDLHGPPMNFSKIKERAANLTQSFKLSNGRQVRKLWSHRDESSTDPNKLIRSLELNARAEIFALMSSRLCPQFNLRARHIKFKEEVHPHPAEVGISDPSVPDFLIPNFGIVGDIKTGMNFLDIFLATCAGYAVAYENEKGKGNDIDFGVCYFFQTRWDSEYSKTVTFAQPHIFAIDDTLRSYFIDLRDRAYEIVTKNTPPPFPADKSKCPFCPYLDGCTRDGLTL